MEATGRHSQGPGSFTLCAFMGDAIVSAVCTASERTLPPCTGPLAGISCHVTGELNQANEPLSGDDGPGGMVGGMIVNDNALSRIPFRVRDEMTILSMARWMRFVGAIKVVGGLVTVFVLLVGIIYIGAVLNGAPTPATGPSSITVSVGNRTEHVPLDKLRRMVSENQVTFYALGAFAIDPGRGGDRAGVRALSSGRRLRPRRPHRRGGSRLHRGRRHAAQHVFQGQHLAGSGRGAGGDHCRDRAVGQTSTGS